MMTTSRVYALCLGAIAIFALFIRVYQLDTIPVGLHGDEASIGYNAYSFLKTGKDQEGNSWPLSIDQFGDYRPAGYHYLDIPFVAAFGLTPFAVRLPSALFGAASVVLFCFLVNELFGSKKLGLLSALLLSVSPWHVNISRATSEGIVAAFFILLGTYLFIRGSKLKIGRIRYYVGAVIAFIVSMLFYHSARIFVPAIFPVLWLFTLSHTKSTGKEKITLALGFVTIVAILAFLLTSGKGSFRPIGVSIFNIPGVANLATQQIGEDGQQNVLVSRFFHNKFFNYFRVFLDSYFFHFSGEFFFVNTGNPLRYRVPWSGNLYLADFPFLLLGGAVLLVDGLRRRKYIYLLPVAWLLLGAVPGGLTFEDLPNIQRASLMVPALIMMIAIGIREIHNNVASGKIKTAFWICMILIMGHNMLTFSHNYFRHLKSDEPWYRSASISDLLFSIETISKDYKYVIMTSQGNNNLVHYLFYHRIDPGYFQKLGSPRESENLRFRNVVYKGTSCPLGSDSEAPVEEDPNILYVNQYNCKIPQNVEVVREIYHPDGSGAYRILKINPLHASPDLVK